MSKSYKEHKVSITRKLILKNKILGGVKLKPKVISISLLFS